MPVLVTQYHNVIEQSRRIWLPEFSRRWQQGEHIALIGPTGTGKTGLAADLLSARSYVVVFAIKRVDDTLKSFKGYKIIKRWPPDYDDKKLILWVKPQSLGDIIKQRTAIIQAMEEIHIAGGWCVYFDDLSYVCDQLRIKTPVVTFMNQGRANGISAVNATQRPSGVPRHAFNQTRHTIIYHYEDEDELVRAAQIAGIPRKHMIELNQQLQVYPKGYSDYLSFGKNQIRLVRNVR